MERVFAVNEQGQREEVDAVRYFEYNGFNYFIYDKKEKDENNYIKLYVNKSQNGNILPIDDNEWANLKVMFQNILKANRDGASMPVKDLNLNAGEIKVAYNQDKAFKLADKIVELLGKNKPLFSDDAVEVNSVSPINNSNSFTSSPVNNNFDINNNAPITTSFNDNYGMNNFNIGSMNNSLSSANTGNIFGNNSNNNINDMNNGFGNFGFNSVKEDVQSISNNYKPTFDNMNNNPFTSNFGKVADSDFNVNQTINNQNPFEQKDFGNINPSVNNVDTTDYKSLYETEKAKNTDLSNELASVKNELNMFTAKFEQLRQIIG